jgi:hypothetical protein
VFVLLNSAIFTGILGLLESKLLQAYFVHSPEPARICAMNLWGVAADITLALFFCVSLLLDCSPYLLLSLFTFYCPDSHDSVSSPSSSSCFSFSQSSRVT